jgi:transcriptional regulator with XRE-family HTH domain
MEAINDRIAWCVKDSKLTKTAFSERLNVSQAFISQLCSGTKTPSDRTIADICREFNISELWLRTGEGEPHIERDEDEEFLEVMEQIHMSDDDLIKRIIKAYWFMNDEEKAAIRKLIDGFTKK